ncbi:MAG: ribokinase [Mobilicoccus sp.]|nr:ribokinase [Mobilicoccus sp.]
MTSGDVSGARRDARVMVVGSINVDLFARVARHPRPGETILGSDGSTRAGGKGANQAVAAALAGAATVMVGCVGDDPVAGTGTSLLERAGVSLAVRTVADTPTGVALIAVSDAGENTIIVIPGANAAVTLDDVRAAEINAGDVVVLQGEIPLPVVDATAALAVEAGARVVVNLAPVVDLAPATLRLAHPLVVNEHEARAAARLLGLSEVDADDESPLTVEDASTLGARLIEAGVASVVVTLGEAGAVAVCGDGATHCPGEHVEVVDTTGAGDCFVGTLAAALLTGVDLAAAAEAGNRAGARAVGASGAQESYAWEDR